MSARAVELVLEQRCLLGEGPSWDPLGGHLLFVDILRGEVHRLHERSGRVETFAIGEPVGAAVPRGSGGLALAAQSGFATLDLDTGALDRLATVREELPGSRMNDGKCDHAGRFWAGTQSDVPEARGGALYRLDADGSVTRALTGVGISNGLGWSPDGDTLFYVDTAAGGVDAFDFDPERGTLAGRRRVIDVPADDGAPDGLAIDADGRLWLALFGGGAVRCYAPDGTLEEVVELPVTLVTSCAFGADDLGTLYITSAAHRLAEPEQDAGAVFACRPGAYGRREVPYAG